MEHGGIATPIGDSSAPFALPAAPAVRTWHLFTAWTVVSLAFAWLTREQVMTREFYQHTLGERMASSRVDAYFDSLTQYDRWGYLGAPAILWVRLSLVALLAQLYALLAGIEIPLRKLFRAACWAFPALLYGIGIHIYVLARVGPAKLDEADLTTIPGSVSAFVLDPSAAGTPLYSLLNFVNLWQALWAVVFVIALGRTQQLGVWARAGVVAAVWCTTTLFQWALTLYMIGVR